jgi:dethiobiotin synthetase
MRMGRRRPLMRAAMVGGVAYHAGKKVQQGREQDADTQARLDDLEQQQYQQQQQPAYAPPAPAAPPPPAPNQGISPEAMEQLKQLAELKSQGILTDEEFAAQKAKILGL